MVIGTSFYFTVKFGESFGPKKSAEWMVSFTISIFESIFMSQPIKVRAEGLKGEEVKLLITFPL